ncbi:MAG: ATP-binding cassette domain-containing protein [Pseudomonadota bacterium]
MSGIQELRALRWDRTVLAASFTANVLGLALPIMMIQIYDRVIPNAGVETLTLLAIGVASAIVAEGMIRMARSAIMARSGDVFSLSIYDRTLESAFDGRDRTLAQLSPAVYLSRIQQGERVRAHYCGDLSAAILDLPFVIAFSALMVAISPVLGLSLVCFLILVFVAVHVMRRREVRIAERRAPLEEQRQAFVFETLLGIEGVKSLGTEDLFNRRYERLLARSAPLASEQSAQVHLTHGVTATIGLMAPIVTVGIGAHLVLAEQLTVGALAASVVLAGRMLQPVLRIEALLVGQEDVSRAERELAQTIPPMTPAGTTGLDEVRSVTLSAVGLEGGGRALFSDVDLDLKKGDCISIAGPDGAGKSVLLKIISGEIQPTSGEVRYNNEPIAAFDPRDRRRRIALLTSENRLLDGTIADNLTGFAPDERLPEARRLTRELGIEGFIHGHRNGYEHHVAADAASALPMAIRDCVVIIGNLVHGPDVILFDEANVRLDRAQDARLRDILARLRSECILVLVTVRPSFLRLAGRHFELVDGQLVERSPVVPLDLGYHGRKIA